MQARAERCTTFDGRETSIKTKHEVVKQILISGKDFLSSLRLAATFLFYLLLNASDFAAWACYPSTCEWRWKFVWYFWHISPNYCTRLHYVAVHTHQSEISFSSSLTIRVKNTFCECPLSCLSEHDSWGNIRLSSLCTSSLWFLGVFAHRLILTMEKGVLAWKLCSEKKSAIKQASDKKLERQLNKLLRFLRITVFTLKSFFSDLP